MERVRPKALTVFWLRKIPEDSYPHSFCTSDPFNQAGWFGRVCYQGTLDDSTDERLRDSGLKREAEAFTRFVKGLLYWGRTGWFLRAKRCRMCGSLTLGHFGSFHKVVLLLQWDWRSVQRISHRVCCQLANMLTFLTLVPAHLNHLNRFVRKDLPDSHCTFFSKSEA